MTKDPAILFYTSDFITGTLTMTDDQVGKYIRLLCLQHQKGSLSEKDMLFICKSYDEDVFSKFEKTEDNRYFNRRMNEEIERRSKYSESRRNNRIDKKNSPKKLSDMNNISLSYDNHMETENVTINKDVILTEKEVKGEKTKFAEYVKMTNDEYEKLVNQFGEIPAKRMIEILDNYKGSKGKTYKSDYRAILNWVVTRYNEEKTKQNGTHSKFSSLSDRTQREAFEAMQSINDRLTGNK